MKAQFFFALLWSTVAYAQQCRIAGQVFFSDVVDHTITIKTDSGDLINFSYDRATPFLVSGQGSGQPGSTQRIPPEELNNGDRLCVGTSAPPTVMVTPRREIDAAQTKELAAWQADSLYGVVSALDRNGRRMTLKVLNGGNETSHSVDVLANAAFWAFSSNAIRLKDATPGSLDRVAPGDTLYVRGTKGSANRFAASLVVSGGFRSFAATIETMETLDEQMHVRLLLSGDRRTVHVGLDALYAVGRADGTTAGVPHRLYPISAGDLQPGDTVLILGVNEGQNLLRACALITGFSPFGVLPPDPSQQMRWIFDNLSLSDPY